MVANLVLATLSYVASSTRKAARPGRIRMIGRHGVFEIKDGPKRTALENLKAAGAQQAHN